MLIVTAIWPSARRPVLGTFVRTQVQALREAGVDLDLLVLDARPRKLAYPKGVLQLRHRLARGDVDLVHAHYGLVGLVCRLQRSVPLVVTYHGSDLLGEMVAEGRIAPASRLEAASSRWLARRVDAVVVQSAGMAAAIPRGTPTYVVPHEVDLRVMRPKERGVARGALGLDPDRDYLIFAAHPDNTTKGYTFAREVVGHLRQRRPRVELLVLWREPQERFALYLSAADALIFPSLQEGSPNVVKQAMACNLPIVATDVGDVRLRMEGVPGCHVCPRRVEPFAAALEDILRRGSRSAGRQRVAELDCPIVAARMIEVYERTLARARS